MLHAAQQGGWVLVESRGQQDCLPACQGTGTSLTTGEAAGKRSTLLDQRERPQHTEVLRHACPRPDNSAACIVLVVLQAADASIRAAETAAASWSGSAHAQQCLQAAGCLPCPSTPWPSLLRACVATAAYAAAALPALDDKMIPTADTKDQWNKVAAFSNHMPQ
jgi:hypothetical protein